MTYLSLDWITLVVYNCIGRDNAERRGIGFYDFEFNRTHTSSYNKRIIFVNGTVCFEEIWFQVYFEQITKKISNVKIFLLFFFK